MDGWHAGDVETNGIRLHYTRTGGAKPPLVLAHGATEDGLCWAPVAAALAPDYDVVMVDARGHGRSEATEHGYDPLTQAADLAGVIVALGLNRPAILGHSMGAGTALALAGTAPDVPGAVLLEDPGPWWTAWPRTEEERTALAQFGERQAGYRRMTREALVADRRTKYPAWQEAELGPWADAKRRVSPEVFKVFEPETYRDVDWSAVLRRITCPVLLITADPAMGGFVAPAAAAAFRDLVPHARVVRIPEAGHNIRRDQFARYLEVTRAFLAEQPAP